MCRILLVFITFFVLIACSKLDYSAVDLNVGDAVPLTWLSGEQIVIGINNEIKIYDLKNKVVVAEVPGFYDKTNFSQANCFSPFSAAYALDDNTLENKSNGFKREYVTILDWKEPDKLDSVELTIWWNTNPIDCFQYDNKKRDDYVELLKREKPGVFRPQFGPLLRLSHGDSYLIHEKLDNGVYEKYLEVHEKYKFKSGQELYKLKRIHLDKSGLSYGKGYYHSDVSSFYDIEEDNYLLYEKTNEFDVNLQMWPLVAWRLSSDLEITDRILLPAGPWVRKHTFFKMMSCFSCGCACYSHFYLTGGGGKIFAHVYGKAVDDDDAGVYQLINTKDTQYWEKIYIGNFNNKIIVSPDGCNIVLSDTDRRLKRIQLCNGKS